MKDRFQSDNAIAKLVLCVAMCVYYTLMFYIQIN